MNINNNGFELSYTNTYSFQIPVQTLGAVNGFLNGLAGGGSFSAAGGGGGGYGGGAGGGFAGGAAGGYGK